jgi:hypothetical protein
MPKYFFDSHDDDRVVRDEEGLVLAGIEEARDAATRGMADLARDVLPGAHRRELAIVVRDTRDRRLLRASLVFEVSVLRQG